MTPESSRIGRAVRWLAGVLLATGMAVRAAPPGQPAQAAPGFRELRSPEAIALLQQRATIEPKAAAVLARVTKAYQKLQTLETHTKGRGVVTVARLKRPRYYHYLQHKPDGELIALALSDGKRYYEYTERNRTYLERDAAILDRVSLPTNVRFFFPAQKPGQAMEGLDGAPATRDYAISYLGPRQVRGRKAEALRVSTMVRSGRDQWITFDSERDYDSATGLLIRAVSGKVTTLIDNFPNRPLPAEGFRWKPIPDARKGFG